MEAPNVGALGEEAKETAQDDITAKAKKWVEETKAKLERKGFMWFVRLYTLGLLACLFFGALMAALIIEAPPGMIMFTIFAAITMMEFLKERLIYMTDNNLMYRQLPARKVLCQSRNLFLCWIWIPAAIATKDQRTQNRIYTETLVGVIILGMSLITAEHFTDKKFFPMDNQIFGVLIILAGVFAMFITYRQCGKGEIYRSNPDKQPRKIQDKNKNGKNQFPKPGIGDFMDKASGLVPGVPENVDPQSLLPQTPQDGAAGVQDLTAAGSEFRDNAHAAVTGRNFGGSEVVTGHVVVVSPVMVAGQHLGSVSDPNEFLNSSVEKSTAQAKAKAQDKWDKVNDPKSFAGLAGPVLGVVCGVVSAVLFYVFGVEGHVPRVVRCLVRY